MSFKMHLILIITTLNFYLYLALSQRAKTPYSITEVTFDIDGYSIAGKIVGEFSVKSKSLIVFVFGSGPTAIDVQIEHSQSLRTMVDVGYDVLLYDKPGFGKSVGQFDTTHIISQRRAILTKLVDKVRNKYERIGVFGGSQAAYIAPFVAEQKKLDFLVLYSCPMQNSVEQGAYQIEQYFICAGYDTVFAKDVAQKYMERENTQDYHVYLENATYLNSLPEIRDCLEFGGILTFEQFGEYCKSEDRYMNPINDISSDIPFLALYGANDKNIDPYQAVKALKEMSLHKASKIVLLDSTDHNMIVGGTGCIQEQLEGYKTVERALISDSYLRLLKKWLLRNN